MDSPADPVVWTMLFSRIVERPRVRKKATESTAIGIDADTVSPILSARYTLDAAKTQPEQRAQDQRADGELGGGTVGWDERGEDGRLVGSSRTGLGRHGNPSEVKWGRDVPRKLSGRRMAVQRGPL